MLRVPPTCKFISVAFALTVSTILVRLVGGAPSQISLNHRQFADLLTSDLYENENECTSSWGLSMAFSLVYPSSTGASEEQIRTLLGYPAGSQQELVWAEVAARMDVSYEGRCLRARGDGVCNQEEPTLEIANSVWIDDDFELNPEYLSIVQDSLREIEFSDETAGGIINNWVENSTLGLIESVVEDGPLPSATVLVAINAIYLKAQWEYAFSTTDTNQDVFYTSPSREDLTRLEAHFMHQAFTNAWYSHEALAGFQLLQLSFTSDLSMIFALPTSFTADALSSDVLSALPELTRTYVAVALPKFKFESEYRDNLIMSLMRLGMTEPFMNGLCIAADAPCDASISDLIQKTAIDMNENGVEAAAASVAIVHRLDPISPPVLFLADHPFQFFIYDELEELFIFEGRVGNPGVPEGSSSPALTARHSESDFWTTQFGVDPIIPDLAEATQAPTMAPSSAPTTSQPTTPRPTTQPTPVAPYQPTLQSTPEPTEEPTQEPTLESTDQTAAPSSEPTPQSTPVPSQLPTPGPTLQPSFEPTLQPTPEPSSQPTHGPTRQPSAFPTAEPTLAPTALESSGPTLETNPFVNSAEAPDSSSAYSLGMSCWKMLVAVWLVRLAVQ